MTSSYRPHKVIRRDLEGGEVRLTSGYEMGPVAAKVSDWLDRWAGEAPERVALAERSGAGWRKESYAAMHAKVDAIAAALLGRGMGQDTPILILSGNGIDHALLALAAHKVAVPIVPIAEQYGLIEAAHGQIDHVVKVTQPRMVFAADGDRFAAALARPCLADCEKVISTGDVAGATRFADLLAGDAGADVAAGAGGITHDTVAKYLMTSGSTSAPKAVITTQGMLCANQAQIADALPFLTERPPVLVDWLPWNHTFGGSHNFFIALANGGTLYIDDGKPAPGLVERSIENLRLQTGTVAFNVPVGFARVLEALRADEDLKRRYFERLDMLFYAGASLPRDTFEGLAECAREVTGTTPLMTSSWGLTETAPACLIQHQKTDQTGVVGVPMTGTEVRLLPVEENRYEVRVKGPNVFPGYLGDAEKTAEAFDEEGFFRTGDVMSLIDPEDVDLGLRFFGRLSEEFKLTTGTWVRAAALRLDLLGALGGIAHDVVICGPGRSEIGVMIVPLPGAAEGTEAQNGLLAGGGVRRRVAEALARYNADHGGSARRVARAVVLAEPPSMPEGEVTAKGNLNFKRIMERRAGLVDRLYGDDPAVIRPA